MIGSQLHAAQNVTLTDGQITQITGWENQGSVWLVVYDTSASDGVVYITTRPGVDGAGVGDVQDRRKIRPPAQFYCGPYDFIGIGTLSGDEAPTINFEFAASPVQPIRGSTTGKPCPCER